MARLMPHACSNGSTYARRERTDMTNQSIADTQATHPQTVGDYVGDMVASESHIEEALDRQLAGAQDDPEGRAAMLDFHDMVKQHRDVLVAPQE
jgi:hypothetical protein